MAVIFDHDALVMENGMFFTIVIDFNPQLFDQTVALVAVVEPQIYVAAFAVLRPGVVNAEAQPFQKDRTDAVRSEERCQFVCGTGLLGMALLDGFRTQGPTDFEGSGGLLLFREPENRVEEQGRTPCWAARVKRRVQSSSDKFSMFGCNMLGVMVGRNNASSKV